MTPHYMSDVLRRSPKSFRASDGKAIAECAADELDRLTNAIVQIQAVVRRPDHADMFTTDDLNAAWDELRQIVGQNIVLPGKL